MPVEEVEIPGILASQCLHDPADDRIGHRCRQQIHMIGHAHIGMDSAAESGAAGGRCFQIEPMVEAVDKDDIAVVAALNDMPRMTGRENARLHTIGAPPCTARWKARDHKQHIRVIRLNQ